MGGSVAICVHGLVGCRLRGLFGDEKAAAVGHRSRIPGSRIPGDWNGASARSGGSSWRSPLGKQAALTAVFGRRVATAPTCDGFRTCCAGQSRRGAAANNSLALPQSVLPAQNLRRPECTRGGRVCAADGSRGGAGPARRPCRRRPAGRAAAPGGAQGRRPVPPGAEPAARHRAAAKPRSQTYEARAQSASPRCLV